MPDVYQSVLKRLAGLDVEDQDVENKRYTGQASCRSGRMSSPET
jgi:hypothetical protein